MQDTDNLHQGHRERVKTRFLERGVAGFDRHQLIELLLFFGIPRKDTNELAHRLENRFRSYTALFDAPYEVLMEVPGMTPNAATLMRLISALMSECERERFSKDNVLDSTEKLANFILPRFLGVKTERVLMVCLDNSMRVLGEGVLAEGSVSATEINIRKALQLSMQYNATMAVLAHNHPGGRAIPSREDLDATVEIVKALAVADVKLVDHLVVANESYTSMRSMPLCATAFDVKYR